MKCNALHNKNILKAIVTNAQFISRYAPFLLEGNLYVATNVAAALHASEKTGTFKAKKDFKMSNKVCTRNGHVPMPSFGTRQERTFTETP